MLCSMPDILQLRDAVDGMVRVLVCDSTRLTVGLAREDDLAVIYIMTSADDLGKVLGKKGRTIGALRLLVQASSRHIGRNVRLDISAHNNQQ
jgi:predicted RNA-binding protein YlqC (UPF0109 family)